MILTASTVNDLELNPVKFWALPMRCSVSSFFQEPMGIDGFHTSQNEALNSLYLSFPKCNVNIYTHYDFVRFN